MQVYLDNAATTPLDSEVISEMNEFMKAHYGNPSSTHSKGREAKVQLEKARKKIASIIGSLDKEIVFTSGGTEANNAILKTLALNKVVKRIISSPIEHHSVLDTLNWVKSNTAIEVIFLNVDEYGNLDLVQLEELLLNETRTLVTLMHANNEIGNILDLELVGNLCAKYSAIFHSDMVQTLGHLPLKLNSLPIDFATASAHKIYGPKGAGFIYINSKNTKLMPFMHGGSQERSIRGGTENISGIIGMAKAYELAAKNDVADKEHFVALKKRMIDGLLKNIPKLAFNGNSDNLSTSLTKILNIKLPGLKNETLMFNLDLEGLYVSEGSACSSGASKGSHVINMLQQGEGETNNVRISFSKFNTKEDIDYAIRILSKMVD